MLLSSIQSTAAGALWSLLPPSHTHVSVAAVSQIEKASGLARIERFGGGGRKSLQIPHPERRGGQRLVYRLVRILRANDEAGKNRVASSRRWLSGLIRH